MPCVLHVLQILFEVITHITEAWPLAVGVLMAFGSSSSTCVCLLSAGHRHQEAHSLLGRHPALLILQERERESATSAPDVRLRQANRQGQTDECFEEGENPDYLLLEKSHILVQVSNCWPSLNLHAQTLQHLTQNPPIQPCVAAYYMFPQLIQ